MKIYLKLNKDNTYFHTYDKESNKCVKPKMWTAQYSTFLVYLSFYNNCSVTYGCIVVQGGLELWSLGS